MSSTTTSSSQQQRNLQRERERCQRERQQVNNNNIGGPLLPSGGQSVTGTLFAEPIKKAQEDETTRRIKSTLGDFNQVQLYLNYDSKPILGLTPRDLNRINGNKAKIEQIFSEMKHTFQPLGALEDGESEESHDRDDDDGRVRRNGDEEGSEDGLSMSPVNLPSNMANPKRKRKLSHDRDSSEDDVSDIVDKSSGRVNHENNEANDSDSSSSSDSSNSASSSSGSSSSSSSSDDEEDDDEIDNSEKSDHAKMDSINSTDLSSSLGNSSIKNQCRSPEPEISTWNLTNFMDKKTIASSTVSTNSFVNKESVKVTNDSINDVIDRVARGELGENSSFDDSVKSYNVQESPVSKKKKKSQNVQHQQHAHRNDHRREHQQRQQLKPSPSIQQSDHASRLSLPNQQRSKAKISSENNDRVRKELKEINNINNNKSDVSPKAPDKLVVSISLVLLKRIPGQNNRVKNELDSDNFTRTPVKNEPLSPQNWSSLSHSQSDGYSNKRHSSPPPAPQPPQTSSQDVSIPSTSSNSASISASSSHLLPFTPPLPSSLGNRATPDNFVADDYLSAAKRLKHDADRETDRTVQARKYLQAVLYFIITGNTLENRSCNNLEKVYCMYKETLRLIRFISDKFKSQRTPQEEIPTTEFKLAALSYRCQSLLSLKLSRLKDPEIRQNNKYIQTTINDYINPSKATKAQTITIPSQLFSAMHRQLTILQQLNYAHDLWQQADHLVEKHPSCAAFFSTVDNECGPLSLNSSFDDLVRYVTTGLKILE